MVSGQADIATASDSVLVSNSFRHRDLKALAVISEGKTNKLVARKDHRINGISDLAGKRVGLVKKSSSEYSFSQFLSLNDINFSDVEIIDLAPSQIVSAIIAGKINAGVVHRPDLKKITEKITGKVIIWNLQDYDPFYFLLITKAKWVNDHPTCAVKFVKALVEAEKSIREDNKQLTILFKKLFNYSGQYLEPALNQNLYYIYLPQALLFEFESQAFWQMKNELIEAKEIPNYLDFIYPYALEVVDSQRVNLIR